MIRKWSHTTTQETTQKKNNDNEKINLFTWKED
jgi:hypothetical protein